MITAPDVMRRVSIIADDSMMGRDTPSRGLELTAGYVASEFQRAGLRPAGDSGSYIQRFGLSQWVVDTVGSAVRLSTRGSHDTARLGVDARYIDGPIPEGPIRGDVFLMSGPGALGDVTGRIVLLVADVSRPVTTTLNQQILELASAGVQAVLVLSNRDSATFADRLRIASTPRLTRDSLIDTGAAAPILEIHDRAVVHVLAAAGIDPVRLRARARPERRLVAGLRVEIRLVKKILSHVRAPNVVGILDGTDPVLRHEYVAYSSHIDHIGITSGQADSINNGADDNASGVAGLLELVEAFTLPGTRPRRSLLFLAPSAEEPGLLGSAHFTEHPTVPIGSIVADINMDLIGRNWADSVIAVGIEHSDLGETLARVVRKHPELRMTPIADRWPEEQIFYRSDHYNFARRGVPVLFFTSGTHPDYHRPTDQTERINGEKESRLLRLLFYLGADIANRDSRPHWHPESYRRIVDHR
jgi:Peptidase family M28